MNNKQRTRATIAFIATPNFKAMRRVDFENFVRTQIPTLCEVCDVVSTGNTHTEAMRILGDAATRLKRTFRGLEPRTVGMVRIAHMIVENRLAGVIHLMDADDVLQKSDSAVVRREAVVHDLPIASDMRTAELLVRRWRKLPPHRGAERFDPNRHVFAGLDASRSTIALIAHDGRKQDMACFAVEHAKQILCFDAILCTGHTGSLVRSFLVASGHPPGLGSAQE